MSALTQTLDTLSARLDDTGQAYLRLITAGVSDSDARRQLGIKDRRYLDKLYRQMEPGK